jgi:cation diffusion facilitator family transporter
LQVGLIYLLVSIFVFALKSIAAAKTHSTALFSDALETLVNIAAAIVSLVVLKFISQPKDENHPYGHGKAEFISSAVEGGFVLSAGLAIFIEAARDLFSLKKIEFNNIGLIVAIVATAINVILAFYLKQASRRRQSVMLNASSVHVMSDVWTTIGVLLGLGVSKFTGFLWIDPLIAICLAVFLFHEGYKLLRESFSGLTDELDPQILQELSKAFQTVIKNGEAPEGLIDLHAVRFIRSGNFHHVDAHIVLPRFWDVSKTHVFMEDIEKKIVQAYRFDGEIAFHVDPCEPVDCTSCDYPDCPVRSADFVKRKSFTPEELAGEKKIFHLSGYRQ